MGERRGDRDVFLHLLIDRGGESASAAQKRGPRRFALGNRHTVAHIESKRHEWNGGGKGEQRKVAADGMGLLSSRHDPGFQPCTPAREDPQGRPQMSKTKPNKQPNREFGLPPRY